MGYSTTQIEVGRAKKMTRGWTVFEASAEIYFRGNFWRYQVASADIREGGQVIFFRLKNGDFVSVEPRP